MTTRNFPAEELADGIGYRARTRLVEAMERHGLNVADIIAIFGDAGLNDPEGE